MGEDSVLLRVANGEQTAVSDCLDRYGGLVWSLARRFCPTQADAEDAVQEVFLDVWKSAARYNPDVSAETTFIAMIARRRLIDRQRKSSREFKTGRVELNEASAVSEDSNRQVEINDEARIANQILNQFPNEQRNAIRLSVYEGLSHSRIAEATGLSLGTVKTHIRRGLIKLREAIQARSSVVEGVRK